VEDVKPYDTSDSLKCCVCLFVCGMVCVCVWCVSVSVVEQMCPILACCWWEVQDSLHPQRSAGH